MNDPLAVLQRIRESKPVERPRPGEHCEMCGEPIGDRHGHVVDVEQRNLMCTCRGCYLLFTPEGAGGSHFRAVPDRVLSFPAFDLPAAQWDALQIPVSVAFFFINSTMDRVAAFYPSPAGATESLLSLDTWDDIVRAGPDLATLLPDVEAFLVRTGRAGRAGGSDGRGNDDHHESECFLVPIDACYELVGRLRRLWKGFDGGREARDALDAFFVDIRSRARPVPT